VFNTDVVMSLLGLCAHNHLQSFIPMLINPAKDDSTILKEVGDFVIHIGTTILNSGLCNHFALTLP
jgi:hypothetical protein